MPCLGNLTFPIKKAQGVFKERSVVYRAFPNKPAKYGDKKYGNIE